VLDRRNRLRQRQDFTKVYQRGSRYQSSHLILRVYRQPGQPTRIGISVSQKVSKRAVVRNRIKRWLRAACRCLLMELQPGWDLVIGVRPQTLPGQESPVLECDYQQFLQELKQLLAEAKLLHGH
jgi:ribonuclease P protein component